MRIFDIEISGKTYKACCGLRVMAELQKEYGTLDDFEKRLLGQDGEQTKYPDAEVAQRALKLFLQAGNSATNGDLSNERIEEILNNADDLYGLVGQVYDVYCKSISPDNEEEAEKN